MLLDLQIALVEEEHAACGVAVTARPSGLLQVALERRRRLVVHDVADVGLVDAEAEGAGRHHDDPLALLHEAGLMLAALLVGHLAVVAGARNLDETEPEPHVIDHLRGRAVDDARTRQPTGKLREMAQLLVAAEVPDGEHEVVAVRRGDDDLGLAEPEVPDDVVAHGWRRGRGEGEDLAGAETGQALTERQVGGTEIVTPLRDAVRLVDRDEARRALCEERSELVTGEGLGCGQHEDRPTRRDAGQRRAPVGHADRAVEPHRRYAELLELQELIFEQGEERRYHYRRSRQEERGKLVAEGLSAARGQDEEHVAAAKHRTDRALLLAMKTRDAEALPRHLPELVNPRGGGTHRRFESRLETFHRR